MENFLLTLATGWNDLNTLITAEGYTGSLIWVEFSIVNRSANTLGVKGNLETIPLGGVEGSTYTENTGQVWDCEKDGIINGDRIFLHSDGGGDVEVTFIVKGGA